MNVIVDKEKQIQENNKVEFDKALLLRQFEIDNFWKRGWFFGALMLAIATGYFSIEDSSSKPVPLVCISFLAFLISLAQSLMNRGSKYWQERWEYVTKNRESALGIDLTKTKKYNENERFYIDACIRAKDENIFSRGERFSVSKIAFLTWDVLTISAFIMWLKDVGVCFDNKFIFKYLLEYKILIFHFSIMFYIFIFWKNGKVYQKLKKRKKEMRDDKNNLNYFYKDRDNYINNITEELESDE